jgi:general stress protein CsbA
MEIQNNKGSVLVRSMLTGVGTTVLYLLTGTVLDYIVTQVLSQFLIADCSENCYFRYFDAIFILVVSLSVAGGIRSAVRAYKHWSEKV